MREFDVKKDVYIKSDNSTDKIMFNVILALIPIVLFAFFKNGVFAVKNNFDLYILFKPLILILISLIITILTEYLWNRFSKNKISFKEIIDEKHIIVTALLFALIIPINTPIILVCLGSIIASILGKLIYGGIGQNLFNPALIGRLFIITAYSGLIIKEGGYLNLYEQTVSAINGATPLANFESLKHLSTYQNVVSPYGSLLNFFVGNIPGSLGETSALLCLLGLIFLIYKKAIKWRIPVTYISTVFIITLIIGFSNGEGLWYPTFQILSGGLFFGAIFMATDPVTSPITSFEQIIYGISLGVLTSVLRFLTPFPEGVLTSILVMNLFVPLFNKMAIKTRFNKYIKYSILIITILIVFFISLMLSYKVKKSNEEVSNLNNSNLSVINTLEDGNKTMYEVVHKGFMGPSSIRANVYIENDKIINIEIIETEDHYYDTHIKNNNFLNELIKNQDDINKVDAISGATYTSNYLKDLTKDILIYHKESK